MTTNINIDFSDLTAFKTEVKSFNTTLGTLSTKIDTFSANVNQFGTNFNHVKEIFTTIKSSLDGVDKIFLGISKAMTAIGKIESFDKQALALERFIQGIKTLGENGNAFAKGLKGVFDGFAKLKNAGITEAFFHTLANGITHVGTAIMSVQHVDLSKFNKSISDLIKNQKNMPAEGITIGQQLAQGLASSAVMGDFIEVGGNSAEKFLEGFRQVAGIASPAKAMIPYGGSLVEGLVKGIENHFPALYDAGKKMFDVVSGIFSKIRGPKQPSNNNPVLNDLVKFIDALAKMNFGNVAKIKPVITALKDIIPELNSMATSLKPKNLKEFFFSFSGKERPLEGLTSLLMAFENVKGIQSAKIISIVESLKLIVTEIGKINLTKFGKKQLDFTILNVFSDVIKSIGTLADKNIGAAPKILDSFAGLLKVIKSFNTIEEEITNIDKNAGIEQRSSKQTLLDPKVLKERLKAIEAFGNFMKKLTGALENLNVTNADKLVGTAKLIDSLRLFFKFIKEIYDEIQTNKTLLDKVASKSFTGGLSAKLLQVFGLNTELSRFIRGLRPFTRLIADSLKNLNDIGSPNTIRAAGNAIRALKDLLLVVTEIPVFMTQFDKAVENISKGFSELSSDVKNPQAEKGIKGVVHFFTGLGQLGGNALKLGIEQAMTFFGKNTRFTQLLRGIQPLTKLLASSLREFKDLPDATKMQGIGATLNAIFQAVTEFGSVGAGQFTNKHLDELMFILGKSHRLTGALRGFRPLVSLIAGSFREFEKIKIHPAVFASLAEFIRGFALLTREIIRENMDEARSKRAANAIKILATALAEGISANYSIEEFQKAGKDTMAAYFEGAYEEAETASPSKVMIRLAGMLTLGFAKGIGNGLSTVRNLGMTFVKAFMGGFNFVKDNLLKVFNGITSMVSKFVSQIHQQFTNLSNNLRNSARSLIQGGTTAIATGGFAGFLTGNISTMVADFDQVIKQIQVFGKVTNETMDSVQDDILEFSAVTKFGPAESADALLNLLKAGLQTADALKALPQVGALAASANLNLADATTLALGALRGFNMEIGQLPDVIDTLVAGADISQADVQDFGNALGFVGQSAVALNIPIKDVTAALALLNDQSITGERAGTGLRGFLDSLAAPSAEAATTIEELGINLKDADGNFIGLGETIREFGGAVQEMREAGMGDIEIVEQLSSLGDRNAITTLLALIKEGSGDMIELADGTKVASSAFDDYRKNLDSANKASDIAAALSDTFKGKVESLKGSIQTVIIKAFQPFLNEVISPLIDGLIQLTNWFAELPKPILKAGAALTVLSSIIVTLGGVFSVVAGVLLLSFIPALQLAGALFTLFFNPMTVLAMGAAFGIAFAIALPVIAAVSTAIAFAIGLIYKFFNDIKTNSGGARDSFDGLMNSLKGLRDTFGELFIAGKDFFTSFFSGTQSITDKMQKSKGGVAEFLDTLRSGVDKITQSMSELKLLFDFFTTQTMTPGETGIASIEDLTRRQIELQDELNAKIAEGGDAMIQKQEEYLIRSGDTLSAISREFGIPIAELMKANPQITNPNLIFAGQKLVLPGLDTTAPSEDVKALQNEIAEVNQQIEDEMLKAVKGQTETQEEALTRIQQKALKLFSQSNLFKKLFGDDEFAVLRAVAAVGKMEDIFKNLSKAVKSVSKGFGEIFKGKFKAGIKGITLGLSKMALEVTNIFEAITGVDISDELQKNLSEGNISGVIDQFVKTGSKLLGDAFEALLPYIVEGAGFILRFALRSVLGGSIRMIANILGIHALDPIFDAIDIAISAVVNKVKETLLNVFALSKGEISLTTFISDLFGIDKWTDKLEVMLALGDITTAVDELKKAFNEFKIEAGLSGINGEMVDFKDVLKEFQTEVVPDIVIGAIKGVAGAISLLAMALGFIGPIVKLFGGAITETLGEIALAVSDIDDEKLKDIGIGLAVIAAPLIAIGIAVGAISIGGILAVAAGILALYVAVKILGEVIDPVLNFLQDLGDLVQAIAKGDWGAALGELRELNQDINDILTGVAVGTIEAFSGIFEAIGALAGIDTTGVVRVLDAMAAMLEGDKNTLAELMGDDIGQRMAVFALEFAIGFEKVKLAMLNFLNNMYLNIVGFLNMIIEKVNDLTGADIGEIDPSEALANSIAETEASLANMENAQHVISMTLDFQTTGDLPDEIANIFSNREFGDSTLEDFIRNSMFAGVDGADIGTAIEDGVANADFSQADVTSVLLNSINNDELTPEEVKQILPPNLADAFEQALIDNINAGFGGDRFKEALDVFQNDETNTFVKDAGKNLMAGMAQGIDENTVTATDATSTAMQDVKDTVTTELETNSPSQFTVRQGTYLMEGLRDGIVQNMEMVRNAILGITGLFDILILKVMEVQLQFQVGFFQAAVMLDANILLMQASIARLIGALWDLNYAAATAMGTMGQVTTSSVTGGTTPQPPPSHAKGTPFTGRGHGSNGFLARLHDEEAVIPAEGMPVVRESPRMGKLLDTLTDKLKLVTVNPSMGSYGGGGNTTIVYESNYGDIHVTNTNPNHRMTPDDIAEGLRIHEERNPRSRKLRNRR